jgi:hypothetical protein
MNSSIVHYSLFYFSSQGCRQTVQVEWIFREPLTRNMQLAEWRLSCRWESPLYFQIGEPFGTRSVLLNTHIYKEKPVQLSRYSDRLQDGRQRGRSSSRGRVKNFLFCMSSRPALGPTQPPIQWVPGVFSPGIKRLGHEADHSPSAGAEFKRRWIYTSTSPYVFMQQYLIS